MEERCSFVSKTGRCLGCLGHEDTHQSAVDVLNEILKDESAGTDAGLREFLKERAAVAANQ